MCYDDVVNIFFSSYSHWAYFFLYMSYYFFCWTCDFDFFLEFSCLNVSNFIS